MQAIKFTIGETSSSITPTLFLIGSIYGLQILQVTSKQAIIILDLLNYLLEAITFHLKGKIGNNTRGAILIGTS